MSTIAGAGGHWEVLKWARSQGCPWIKIRCVQGAVARSEYWMLEWIQSQDQ